MKKLSGWARSRSRRRGSQGKDVEKRASTENLASQNGRAISSRTAPPVPEIPREYRTGRPLDQGNSRPGSSNKMKPMLIGVSRPSGTYSRPGTSGSLQNAVTSAADKVAQSPSADFQQGHTKTKSPRYIDISSISNPKRSLASYNEHVAERNLDTNVVAREGMKNGYVPSSKYQEEVAARNAAPPQRASMEQIRSSSSDGYRPNYAELRAQSMPKEHEVDGRLATDDHILKSNEAEKAAQYRYRRRRQQIGEPVQSTELVADAWHGTRPETNGPDRNRQALRNGVTPKPRVVPQQQQPVVPYSRRSVDDQRHQDQVILPVSASHPPHPSVVTQGTLPGYQVSRSELSQPREADTTMSQQSTSDRPGMPERGSSSVSTASSIKRTINLPHRTIMDLTGEDSDVFSDGYPESYMSRSPVVEQARQDAYSRKQLSIVNFSAKAVQPPGLSDEERDGVVKPRPPTVLSEERQSPEPALQYLPASTFSGINTIASLSPMARQDMRYAPLPGYKHVPLVKETRKPAPKKLYTVDETGPDLEDRETSAEDIRGRSLTSHTSTDQSDYERFAAPVIERHDFATGQKGLEQQPVVPPSPRASLRTPTQSDFSRSPSNGIQLSPESLHLSDFINPSGSFGVLTRDFAAAPSREVPSSRIDQEPNTSAKAGLL